MHVWSPILISLQTALTATALSLVLGVAAAAWRAHRQSRWLFLFDAICLLPMVLPPTVVGLGLLIAFGKRSPIGRILDQIGLPVVFSWPGTVVAAFVVSFPIVFIMARSAFLMIDPELHDVSRLYGVDGLRRLFRVEIPIARAGIMAGAVLGFARALGEFGATLMLAGNIPGRTQTMPVAIFFASEAGHIPLAVSLALVLVSVSIVIVYFANRWAWQRTH